MAEPYHGIVSSDGAARDDLDLEGQEMGVIKKTLWRAADDDDIVGATYFAARRAVAEIYRAPHIGDESQMRNIAFGGKNLYRTKIQVEEKQVLDLRGDEGRERLVSLLGYDPGAIETCDLVPILWARDFFDDYVWVIVDESCPKGEEVWVYVGLGEDPELEQVE